jgi:hypothetical protein
VPLTWVNLGGRSAIIWSHDIQLLTGFGWRFEVTLSVSHLFSRHKPQMRRWKTFLGV